MSVLLTSRIWARITSLVKQAPTRCHVAVAYFGADATSLLPLRKGSTLVVDMSERAVGSGQTKPSEVLKLINRQVDVHTVKNLHAKVFAAGSTAIVGSTNASHTSADGLVEAVVETQDRRLVRSCREFVQSLKGEVVTPEYAKRMQKLYRPPRFGMSKSERTKHPVAQPQHSPTWAVPLERSFFDERATARADAGRPKAKSRLRSRNNFRVDEFHWQGLDLLGNLHVNDLVLQVTEEAPYKKMVSPFGRVLHIERYKVGNTSNGIVFVEASKNQRRKDQKSIGVKLGFDGKALGYLNRPKLLRDEAFVHSLLNLWKNSPT